MYKYGWVERRNRKSLEKVLNKGHAQPVWVLLVVPYQRDAAMLRFRVSTKGIQTRLYFLKSKWPIAYHTLKNMMYWGGKRGNRKYSKLLIE